MIVVEYQERNSNGVTYAVLFDEEKESIEWIILTVVFIWQVDIEFIRIIESDKIRVERTRI